MNIMTLQIVLLIIGLVESILSVRWVPFYFKYGIPLFVTEFESKRNNIISEETVNNLNNKFKSTTGILPTLLFKYVDQETIAFREKVCEFGVIKYTPVMHGKIYISISSGRAMVVGLLNWCLAIFLIAWYAWIDSTELFLVLFPLLIFTYIYYTQSKIYKKVSQYLTEIESVNNFV